MSTTDNPYATSYPAAAAENAHWTERVVTEGHAAYCRENGHATHTVDGVLMPRCPRCGETRPSPAERQAAADAGSDDMAAVMVDAWGTIPTGDDDGADPWEQVLLAQAALPMVTHRAYDRTIPGWVACGCPATADHDVVRSEYAQHDVETPRTGDTVRLLWGAVGTVEAIMVGSRRPYAVLLSGGELMRYSADELRVLCPVHKTEQGCGWPANDLELVTA